MKKSKNLKIEIYRDGKQVVKLAMPIFSATVLDTVIPAPVLSKLSERNINVQEIMEQMKSDNYAPRTLFKMEDENKSYNVWIE